MAYYFDPSPQARLSGTGSDNPLTRKLSHFTQLSQLDEEVSDSLAARDEDYATDVDIITEGSAPRSVFLVKEGMAVRYRNLPDGGRQIMTFLIPGDFCNVHAFLVKKMDHSVGTLMPVRVAPIGRQAMMDLFARHVRLAAALWWSSMQEEAMLRERIVSLGRRDARGRVAYLLCELLWRYQALGMTQGDILHLPLTQTELADTLGLTPVHMNRVLKDFRERGLVHAGRRVLHLLDVQGLLDIAAFNRDYLHLDGGPPETLRYFDELDRRGKRIGKLPAECLAAQPN